MAVTVGLMGFGRIGRNIFRILHRRDDIQVVAISDIADHAALEYLLRFDTVFGRFPDPVSLENGTMRVGGRTVRMLSGREPGEVDWKGLGVEYVVEATARYRSRPELERHLEAGAGHVVLCAPPLDEPDITVIFGVNEDRVGREHRILSNGSCTANAAGPVVRTLHEAFGVRQGFLTAVHAYTNDQRLADVPAADLRRSRAAAENIIPTDTRAHEMLMSVMPALAGRLGGIAMNVPIRDGSVADLVLQLETPAAPGALNGRVREAAAGPLEGILAYEEAPIVSSDVIGSPHSGVFDALATQCLGEDLVRVLVWFDNGWGYAQRAVDLIARLAGAPPAGEGPR
ncbi:MAG: type I glyceraldehyde-3-phosphate dehydrogenase [Acidobacteriota bacterium]